MEKMLEKLNELVKNKVIKLDDFYVISIYGNKIQLQGDMNMSKIKQLRTIFGDPIVDKESWITMFHDDVEITLT